MYKPPLKHMSRGHSIPGNQWGEVITDEICCRLDPNLYTDLWISWYNGFIEVGTGAIAGENVSTAGNLLI